MNATQRAHVLVNDLADLVKKYTACALARVPSTSSTTPTSAAALAAEECARVLSDLLQENGGSVKFLDGRLEVLPVDDIDRAVRFAHVAQGRGVRLIGVRYAGGPGRFPYDRNFLVGDRAVHGAYNLTYTGIVHSVTKVRVLVTEDRDGRDRRTAAGLKPKCKHFTVERFDSWNWNDDMASIDAQNREMSRSI